LSKSSTLHVPSYQLRRTAISRRPRQKALELLQALSRPKPFRSFKDVLYLHEDLLNAFEEEKTQRIIESFRANLADQGYELKQL